MSTSQQISKITVKYQASIPKEIREKLHIKAGDFIEFDIENDQVVLKKANSNIDKNMLKLMQTNMQEWNSKEDNDQFDYLERLAKN